MVAKLDNKWKEALKTLSWGAIMWMPVGDFSRGQESSPPWVQCCRWNLGANPSQMIIHRLKLLRALRG